MFADPRWVGVLLSPLQGEEIFSPRSVGYSLSRFQREENECGFVTQGGAKRATLG
jgi:hypothetical protein